MNQSYMLYLIVPAVAFVVLTVAIVIRGILKGSYEDNERVAYKVVSDAEQDARREGIDALDNE
jgi:nitrogen fixation-related uncharacterized protein